MARTLVGQISRRKQNIIINGAFDFWQRGTSFPAHAHNAYHADRFTYFKQGAMVHTISRDTDVPTFAQSGFLSTHCLRLNLTTPDTSIAATDFVQFQQHIEGFNWRLIAQKACTLSFWVKATLPGIYCVALRSGGNDRSFISEYTINAANTWEKKTIKIAPSPAGGTWNYENGLGLSVAWVLACGTNQQTATKDQWITGNFVCTANQVNGVNTGATDFRIAQVMLNEGSAPAPFQRAGYDIQSELELCQRYFEICRFGIRIDYSTHGNATFESTHHYNVQKRVAPIVAMANITTTGLAGGPTITGPPKEYSFQASADAASSAVAAPHFFFGDALCDAEI